MAEFTCRDPEDDFNPITAPDDELAAHGLPPRPDERKEPALYGAWIRLFDPSAKPRVIRDLVIQRSPFRSFPVGGAVMSGSRYQKSLNWSGAYVVPVGGTMVTMIFGEWTVPMPSLPPPIDQGPAEDTYFSSTWIGLDGQRLYLNSSLPQIGTMQTLKTVPGLPPEPGVFAWQQWWVRDDPNATYSPIPQISLAVGDRVQCLIWVATPQIAVFYIRSGSQFFFFPKGIPTVSPPAAEPSAVSGATAEWIMERPMIPGRSVFYDFPRYAPTQFEYCVAGVAPAPGRVIAGERDLTASRLIRMCEQRDLPSRTAFLSMPDVPKAMSFKTTYGGFFGVPVNQ